MISNDQAIGKTLIKPASSSKKIVHKTEDYSDEAGIDDSSSGSSKGDEESEDNDEFEDQGSSSDEDSLISSNGDNSDSDADQITANAEMAGRTYEPLQRRDVDLNKSEMAGELGVQLKMHVDDLSSDDEEAIGNTIGRVPLHWYDAYNHIGYDITGAKVLKRKNGGDRIDMAINASDPKSAVSRTVYDMYNDRDVVLSERYFIFINE